MNKTEALALLDLINPNPGIVLEPGEGWCLAARENIDLAHALEQPDLMHLAGDLEPRSVTLLTGSARQLIVFLRALLLSEDTDYADRTAKIFEGTCQVKPTCAVDFGSIKAHLRRADFVRLIHDGSQRLPAPLGSMQQLLERLSEWGTESLRLEAQVKCNFDAEDFFERQNI